MGVQLYIHVPFCRKKCAYCAFYSEPSGARIAPYLEKIERELNAFEPPDEIDSVYFGGGTPTLLDAAALQRLFGAVRRLPLRSDAEISMEANPETLTAAKMETIRTLVNRLSIGIQSFDARTRQTLGRDCSDAAINDALRMARSLAFEHLNCDLIYAVPHQTEELWRSDLEQATEAGVDHISCYSLTPEEGTLLVRNGLTGIDDDFSARMWHVTGDLLLQYGLERYEVSNYARPGSECLHNRAVWRGSRLYGFGPSAASYDGSMRYTQVADLPLWLAGAPLAEDRLPDKARRREIAVVQLRTTEGWTRERYLALPGATLAEWRELIAEAIALKPILPDVIHADDERLHLTNEGVLFWDAAASELLYLEETNGDNRTH